MQCPDCGAENPDGSKFCTSCGKQLFEPSQAETTDFSATTYDETSEQTINQPAPEPEPQRAAGAGTRRY